MIESQKRQQVISLLRDGTDRRDIKEKTGVSLATISRIWKARTSRNKQPKRVYVATSGKDRRVLVIGDLHAPFIRDGYLEFCKSVYDEHKCNMVVCTGDVVDNHASSFHTSDPDGMSAGDELSAAIEQLKKWVEVFPKVKVCIGNHDRLPRRQAFESGVSSRWVRDYAEVLGCPNWEFAEGFDIDGVRYEHGEGQKPHVKMLHNRQSYVCGHVHSQLSIQYSVSEHDRLFAMQIGWGGDQKAYSMAYAKNFKKGVVSCGVVLKNGTMPIAIPMPLMDKEQK